MSDNFIVTLAPDQLQVEPGQEIEAVIEIRNVSHILDIYTIEVSGLDHEWYQLSERSFSVFPGESIACTFTITPPAGNEATAKSYGLTAKVTSANFPTEEAHVSGNLRVEPLYSFFHELHPAKVTGVEGFYTNTITNTGNAEMVFHFLGEDPEGFCQFNFDPNPATVPPREELDVGITVKPTKRHLIGRPKSYNLTLTVTPDQTPEVVTLSAQLESLSKLRGWFIPAALLLLLLLILAGYSAFWALLERDNLTYFRSETWSVKTEPFKAEHETIKSLVFELKPGSPTKNDEVNQPVPVTIRGTIGWPATGDSPPRVVAILRDPYGNCWGPTKLGRTSEPFQFPVFNGGTSCDGMDFGALLLGRQDQDHDRATASVYWPVIKPEFQGPDGLSEGSQVEPLVRYCVSDTDWVIFDGKVPKMKSFNDKVPRMKSSSGRYWTLFIVNPHSTHEHADSPNVTFSLKATALGNGERKKSKKYVLELLGVPSPPEKNPQIKDPCAIEWDAEVDVADGGLIHGTIYVKRLEFFCRPGSECADTPGSKDSAQSAGSAGQLSDVQQDNVCSSEGGGESADRGPSASPPQIICGDIVWEKDQDQVVSSVFVILRDDAGNCWAILEAETIDGQDVATPFLFDTTANPKPCSEVLKESRLWYVVNWFPLNFSRPEVAKYSHDVLPLVILCRSPESRKTRSLWFNPSNAIPEVDSYPLETDQFETDQWNIFIINGDLASGDVKRPKVKLKVKGDKDVRVQISEPIRTDDKVGQLVECVPP